MHENICPQQKENRTKNIETRDFSTPTEWNVEMVNDKVIVTLSGGKKKKEKEKFSSISSDRLLVPSLVCRFLLQVCD